MLMAALQYVDQPDYSALLLRKTYPELSQPGGLMDRAHEWLQGRGPRWNETERVWTFPGGAKLAFGYLQHSTDKYRYQGSEWDFVGFDELTHFEEDDYVYLFSRLRRREGSLIPPRMRGATNPGGRGHRWVRRRFIERKPNPDDPSDTTGKCAARWFIPARLADNPGVDQVQYRQALEMLDPQTLAQLLEGDWEAREPGDWVLGNREMEAIEDLGRSFDRAVAENTMRPPVGGQLILAFDWGLNSHGLLLWPLEAGGYYALREFVYHGDSVRTLAPTVADAIAEFGLPVHQERFDASMPGLNEAFLEHLRPLLAQPLKHLAVPFGKYKALAVDYLQLLAERTAADISDPPVLAISPKGCPVLCEQARGMRYADPDTGRIEKGDDHGFDALLAGIAPDAAKRRKLTTTTLRTATRV